MIQLSPEEAERYRECPVVLDFSTGHYVLPVSRLYFTICITFDTALRGGSQRHVGADLRIAMATHKKSPRAGHVSDPPDGSFPSILCLSVSTPPLRCHGLDLGLHP